MAPANPAEPDWFVKREEGKPYDTAWGGTCMVMTHPGARDCLRSVVRKIAKDWGYTYFKMDGMWTGTGTKQIYVNSGYKDEGIGDDERPRVVFQVWADRQLLAESPALTWKTLNRWHFDVPIPAKTRSLRLVVTDAADGIAADHADWVEAGFVK